MIQATDAIGIANEFVYKQTGIVCGPNNVRLVERDVSRYWLVVYDASHFFKDELERGATVEGGEYIIRVNGNDGIASFFG